MSQCPICGIDQDSLPPAADPLPAETTDNEPAALPGEPAPTPRRFQHDDLAFLSDFQPDFPVSDEFTQPPRFSPASPLPPELDVWSIPGDQRKPYSSLARLEPDFSPAQSQADELWPDPSLVSEPDDPANLTIEASPPAADLLPAETTDERSAALPCVQEPRPLQRENQAFLPDFQINTHGSDEFAPPSRFSSSSPLPSARGRRKAPGGRWRTRIVFIILAVILLLAGSGGYIAFSKHLSDLNSLPTMLNPRSTPGPINAPATATATARAANFNPYMPGGTLAFSDTLNAANSHWDQNANCAFKDGSYHITATTIQSCALNARMVLTNFVLEVKVTLLRGNVGGLFFRENKVHNKSNAYLLDFDSKGNYQLWNYSVSHAAKLIDYGALDHWNAGYNQTNTVALVAQGSSMRLYVNRRMARHFTDHTYTRGGLSFISSEYSSHKGTSEATYSDLRIWQF
jgi:hypothetical protein